MPPFAPDYTPLQMLTLGVFGGNYFARATRDDFLGLPGEIPYELLVDNSRFEFVTSRNKYKTRAGLSYDEWVSAGWIFPEDPLGWFHWYCRYSAGRRHHRDLHQILRWQKYGHRWGNFARSQQRRSGDASAVVRQGLLQWGYDPDRVLAS